MGYMLQKSSMESEYFFVSVFENKKIFEFLSHKKSNTHTLTYMHALAETWMRIDNEIEKLRAFSEIKVCVKMSDSNLIAQQGPATPAIN